MENYTLTPHSGNTGKQFVTGFRSAIDIARDIAAREHCTVTVRNESKWHTWFVAFRVRGGRNGARCVVEVTR